MTDDDDRFGLYEPDAQDIIIAGCRLVLTCPACPEQYEVFDEAAKARFVSGASSAVQQSPE